MLLSLILAAGLAGSAAGQPASPLPADDIFAPYTNKTPKVAAVVSESTAGGVRTTRFRFASTEGTAQGTTGPCEIYGVLARPAAPAEAKRPGILFCHGGAGVASEDAAVGWARLGYVCLSPDLVGYSDNKRFHSRCREGQMKYAGGIATVSPTPYANTLFDSVVAGLGAFNLLAAQPDVDVRRIGLTGISCGGYMVTMLSGLLDGRIKAVLNLYGSGYVSLGSVFAGEVNSLPPEQQKTRIANFDAATRLSRARATYLTYAATNDFFFSNQSVIATLAAYAGPKYVCWAPNASHAIKLPGGTDHGAPLFTEMEPAYFACVLAGQGPPLPELAVMPVAAGAKTLKFTVRHCPKRVDAWVYTSPAADPLQKHVDRKWERLAVQAGPEGVFTCRLPAGVASFDWFGGITWTFAVEDVARPMSLSTPLCRHEPAKGDTVLK